MALASALGAAPRLLVLALPRGGVPVAAEVASILQSPLDVLVVRKLGVPWQPELAMGAVTASARVLDEQLIEQLHISPADLDQIFERESVELSRREKLYRPGRPPQEIRNRTVLLVDDGLATGLTMMAAVRHVRMHKPEKIIAAVPVASRQALETIGREADQCVCLAVPSPFYAVGEWYVDFPAVGDREVIETLARFERPSIRPDVEDASHAQ